MRLPPGAPPVFTADDDITHFLDLATEALQQSAAACLVAVGLAAFSTFVLNETNDVALVVKMKAPSMSPQQINMALDWVKRQIKHCAEDGEQSPWLRTAYILKMVEQFWRAYNLPRVPIVVPSGLSGRVLAAIREIQTDPESARAVSVYDLGKIEQLMEEQPTMRGITVVGAFLYRHHPRTDFVVRGVPLRLGLPQDLVPDSSASIVSAMAWVKKMLTSCVQDFRQDPDQDVQKLGALALGVVDWFWHRYDLPQLDDRNGGLTDLAEYATRVQEDIEEKVRGRVARAKAKAAASPPGVASGAPPTARPAVAQERYERRIREIGEAQLLENRVENLIEQDPDLVARAANEVYNLNPEAAANMQRFLRDRRDNPEEQSVLSQDEFDSVFFGILRMEMENARTPALKAAALFHFCAGQTNRAASGPVRVSMTRELADLGPVPALTKLLHIANLLIIGEDMEHRLGGRMEWMVTMAKWYQERFLPDFRVTEADFDDLLGLKMRYDDAFERLLRDPPAAAPTAAAAPEESESEGENEQQVPGMIAVAVNPDGTFQHEVIGGEANLDPNTIINFVQQVLTTGQVPEQFSTPAAKAKAKAAPGFTAFGGRGRRLDEPAAAAAAAQEEATAAAAAPPPTRGPASC
jgi:hypothetical protein